MRPIWLKGEFWYFFKLGAYVSIFKYQHLVKITHKVYLERTLGIRQDTQSCVWYPTQTPSSASLGTFTFGEYTETRHVFHWKWYLCLYMADWHKLRMRLGWGIRQRRHELEFEREIWSNQTLFARGATEQLSKEWMGLTSDAASKFKLQIRSMCKEKIVLSELLLNFISC